MTITDPDLTVHTPIINGVLQAGFITGSSITANGGNGYDIKIQPGDLMLTGAWAAYAYCEDAGAASDFAIWSWTVIANAPVTDSQNTVGGNYGTLSEIRYTITDDWGMDTTTLGFTWQAGVRQTETVISAGVFATGYDGVIVEIDDIGNGPRTVEIRVTTWPVIYSGERYEFRATGSSVVGEDL